MGDRARVVMIAETVIGDVLALGRIPRLANGLGLELGPVRNDTFLQATV
jgi:hypothetical protein